MQRWNSLAEVPAGDPRRSVVTIGVFDGVHRGHRVVIGRAVELARLTGLRAVAVTFFPHPSGVLRPGSEPATLTTLDHRLELLAGCGVDTTLVLPFDRDLAARSPEEFVRTVLVERLRAAHVVVGANFRFGARAAGDLATLAELGEAFGFAVDGVELVRAEDQDEVWSSTWIRARVAAGDVEAAAAALGRPHRIEGVVVAGDRRGRTIGYPTANVEPVPGSAVPGDGVYAGWLCHPGGREPAAISVGTNPTFAGSQRRVEAYVLDRTDLELYGACVAVDFAARLRGMERFDSLDGLLEAMRRDVERTRALTRPSATQDVPSATQDVPS
ncbi:MAG: bifunctional riboflavin kinase/FAD synthetase [Actinomycetota bacterium]|nr:bifunctional riboflavin kinase/FAD synthetase [Actinomycetota bacterium]